MPSLFAYRLAAWLARALPRRAGDALGRALARLAFALRVPARPIAVANQARLAAPGEADARARASFEHFAVAFADFLRLDGLAPDGVAAAVEVRAADHFEAARRSGRGVIVLSAHVGNWEWGAAWLAARGARVHVVARPHGDARVDAFFDERRRRWGIERLTGASVWTRAAAALRRGECLAVMGDRPALGPTRSACGWAASLARRTGAVIVPALVVRTGPGRYAACFEPPLDPDEARAGGFARVLERYVTRYPEQWCAFAPLPESLGA